MMEARQARRDRQQEPSAAEALRLTVRGLTRQIVAGSEVVRDGERTQVVVAVLAGLVRCVRTTPDGRRFLSRFARRGDVIGLGASGCSHGAIETVSDSSVYIMTAGDVRREFEANAATRQIIMKAIADEGTVRERAQFRTTRLKAAERVADFLLELADIPETADGRFKIVRMPRSDMADHLGLTIETVSRALRKFQREGMVRMTDPHHFQVVSDAALMVLAGEVGPDADPNIGHE